VVARKLDLRGDGFALGAAQAVSTVESFAIFTAIGVGLSTPDLLLSIFPQAVKLLPRPGAWMETFKQFMAFPLYATVMDLAWVLAAQTGDEGFRGVLFSLVLIAMAVGMYGRWTAPGASPGRVRLGGASLILVGTFGLWLGWPRHRRAARPWWCGRHGARKPSRNYAAKAASFTSTSPPAGAPPARKKRNCFSIRTTC
jgi:thiol:disulfide interchange protein DsbD